MSRAVATMRRYRLYQSIDGRALRARTYGTLGAAMAAIRLGPAVGSTVTACVCAGSGSGWRIVARWTPYGWHQDHDDDAS